MVMGNVFIDVKLWGKLIGKLYWCSQNRNTFFSFSDPSFETHLNIFPGISDKTFGARRANMYWGEDAEIFKNLPSFLSESLPDSWENEYIMTHYKDNPFLENTVTPLEKLAYIKNRSLGALEYEAGEFQESPSLHWFKEIAFEYEDYLGEFDMPSLKNVDLESICSLGTSSVGLRPKVMLAINNTTGRVRSGLLDLGKDYEYYILKIADSGRGMAEIELSYYQMATAAGISMMPSRMLRLNEINHFMTKRYDRVNGKKLHVQSLSAVSPCACSYEELFDAAYKLNLSRENIGELYRRLIFNLITNNVDDHARNFSFIMNEDGHWSLAPAYDISFSMDNIQAHRMTVNGKDCNFGRSDLFLIAQKYNVPNYEEVLSKTLSSISDIKVILKKNGVNEKHVDHICQRIRDNIAKINN